MTAADNLITNDQYIASNPSFLYQDNSLESPKQDKDTPVLTDYEYVVGSQYEDVSNEAFEQTPKDILWDTLDFRIPKWLHDVLLWEFSIAFCSSHKIVPLPSADVEENIEKNAIWNEILERFDVIAQREDNWDGLESKKPIEESLVRAKRLIEKLLDDILNAGYSWHMFKPLISCDEDGYITVRWRGGGKRLHLLIEEDEVRYIKSWKTNTKRKVSADRTQSDNCFEIWEWLING